VFETATEAPLREGRVVGKQRRTYIEEMCGRLVEIERRTLKRLGKKSGHFVNIANDWIDISSAILDAYPKAELNSFVLLTFWGLFKELCWFHFYFCAGNYPLLLSRLRFVWESVFRACFAETYRPHSAKAWETPGPSADDKVAWLEEHEKDLRWGNCLQVVLCQVFPLSAREKVVREHYKQRWLGLHRYAHPSAYLASRMIGPAALHVKDNFDKSWAVETIDIATDIFDLVWLAVLSFYPKAFDKLAQEGLLVDYPVLSLVFRKGNDEAKDQMP
jgi:hypothetical protein